MSGLADLATRFFGQYMEDATSDEEIRRAGLSLTSLSDTSTSLLKHHTEGTPILDRDRSIIAQNAGTTAANLVASAVAAGTLAPATIDELVSTFDDLRTQVFNGTLSLAGAQSVVESFEGGGAPTATSSAPTSAPAASGGGSRPNADLEIKVGKYRGKTIGHVFDNEDEGDSYLEWMSQNINNDFLRAKVTEFLAAT